MGQPFSTDSLFQETGQTLKEWGEAGVRAGVASLRTEIARDAINSPEGQSIVAQYKTETVMHYLPWLVAVLLVVFIAGVRFK